MPDLFDVIELTENILDRGLQVGMQGTIVECHSDDVYEVEFTDTSGETLDLLALRPSQFIVIVYVSNNTRDYAVPPRTIAGQ